MALSCPLSVLVHKPAKKGLSQYSAVLTSHLANNSNILPDLNAFISGIVVAGYSPIGSSDRPSGFVRKDDPVVLSEPVLKKIAEKHNTTVALVR